MLKHAKEICTNFLSLYSTENLSKFAQMPNIGACNEDTTAHIFLAAIHVIKKKLTVFVKIELSTGSAPIYGNNHSPNINSHDMKKMDTPCEELALPHF